MGSILNPVEDVILVLYINYLLKGRTLVNMCGQSSLNRGLLEISIVMKSLHYGQMRKVLSMVS